MISYKYIVWGLIAVIAVAVGIVILAPGSEAGKRISGWIPGAEVTYVANVEYTVSTTGYWLDGKYLSVKINDVRLEEKVTYFSIGGFWFWPETYRGVVRIEAIHVERNLVVDKVVRDIEVHEGWFQEHVSITLHDQVKLGKGGSGRYKILVTLWDKEGKKVSEDYTYRTI